MRKDSKNKKHIVCLGGGNAMPKAVLTGLKKYPVKISAVCAMFDTGGSAGRLRKDYNIISPGDIRRALIALANTSPAIEALFDYRFQAGELTGHNFANLLITALELTTNNYEETIDEVKKMLNVKHSVLPVTLEKSNICAVLDNDCVVMGEANIDRPKHNGTVKIKKVYLEPSAKAYPKTLDVIGEADLIIIGPGDLYSSLAQILLVEGVSKAILEGKAKTVYLCNVMTKHGETNGFTVSDFTREVESLLGGSLDFVLYNDFFPEKERIKDYTRRHPELIEMVAVGENLLGEKFIGKNMLCDKGPIEHDPKKVAKAVYSLLFQESEDHGFSRGNL